MSSRSRESCQSNHQTEDAGRACLDAIQLRQVLSQWQLPYPVQVIALGQDGHHESEALTGFVERLRLNQDSRVGRRKKGYDDPVCNELVIKTYLAAHAVRLLESAQQVALIFKWKDQRYRTAPVNFRLSSPPQRDGHLWRAKIPQRAESLYTRNHFRAHLHDSLKVEGLLQRGDRVIKVRLLDISAGGCRLLVPVREGVAWWTQLSNQSFSSSPLSSAIPSDDRPHHLGKTSLNGASDEALGEVAGLACRFQLAFPSGEWLKGRGRLRSVYATRRGLFATVSICFEPDQDGLEEQAMRITLETERESARLGDELHQDRLAASLYQGRAPAIHMPDSEKTHSDTSCFPNAPRLQQVLDDVAAVLCIQALRLANDEPFDSELIRQASLSLLKPLAQQPDLLMYMLIRLHGWPSIIRHCMLVASRLYLLAASQQLIDNAPEALLASALLHDLGKLVAHLPVRLSDECKVRAQQSERLRQVLLRVLHGLHAVNWIPRRFLEAALVNPHERLDGSGMPRGLKASGLDTLSRMAAVVDKIDLLSYANDQHDGVRLHDIVPLVFADKGLDQGMVTCYVEYFGLFPVGSLVRFSHGGLAWVLHLDETGLPAEVLVAVDDEQNGLTKGEIIPAGQFASRLGKLKGHAAPRYLDALR